MMMIKIAIRIIMININHNYSKKWRIKKILENNIQSINKYLHNRINKMNFYKKTINHKKELKINKNLNKKN